MDYLIGFIIMSKLQFHQVSLNAVAQISHEGRHLYRTLSFADGHSKVVGSFLPLSEGQKQYELRAESKSAERIEITAGECEVCIDGEAGFTYYREGQSFVVAEGTKFFIQNRELVQYVRHFEG